MKIRAAVARAPDAPFEIVDCDLRDPLAGEVLVRVVACGICHTDIAVKRQHLPVPLPKVLGHEGAGIVEKVGSGVTGVAEGDAVLMSFASCDGCEHCLRGWPGYCNDFGPINIFGRRRGGSALRYRGEELSAHFFGQSAFATHAIASARSVVKVSPDAHLATLAPLGCGIQTGVGAVLNGLRPVAGSSIAIFGAGAVGLAAVMAARLAGCTTIIAIDINPQRLSVARDLGATHVIDGRADDLIALVLEARKGGVHCALDTTGQPAVVTSLVASLRNRGCAALVAAPPRGTHYAIDAGMMVSRGLTIRGVVEGDAVPGVFIPELIDLHSRGLLPIEKLISFFPFEDIEAAVAAMHHGHAIKPVLLMQ